MEEGAGRKLFGLSMKIHKTKKKRKKNLQILIFGTGGIGKVNLNSTACYLFCLNHDDHWDKQAREDSQNIRISSIRYFLIAISRVKPPGYPSSKWVGKTSLDAKLKWEMLTVRLTGGMSLVILSALTNPPKIAITWKIG
ncbi:hypothetical protein MKW98_025142 [Papaver atlanticum]|uniref:Uncharacterized protein n=1 Tax=Papaver atlanticum TaxID=357466 RepID=A0AAD4S1I0_9MAGN|nr:hypothetical protein MKW98_025142 [Papaver atlanticum]